MMNNYDLNEVKLVGVAEGPVKLRKTKAGTAVTNLRIRQTIHNGPAPKELSHDLVFWGDQAKEAAAYEIQKGDILFVSGVLIYTATGHKDDRGHPTYQATIDVKRLLVSAFPVEAPPEERVA